MLKYFLLILLQVVYYWGRRLPLLFLICFPFIFHMIYNIKLVCRQYFQLLNLIMNLKYIFIWAVHLWYFLHYISFYFYTRHTCCILLYHSFKVNYCYHDYFCSLYLFFVTFLIGFMIWYFKDLTVQTCIFLYELCTFMKLLTLTLKFCKFLKEQVSCFVSTINLFVKKSLYSKFG